MRATHYSDLTPFNLNDTISLIHFNGTISNRGLFMRVFPFSGLVFMAACSTTPLTFAALDSNQDGFIEINKVSASERYIPEEIISHFDADADALFDASEFETYVNSEERRIAIVDAMQRRARYLAQQDVYSDNRGQFEK